MTTKLYKDLNQKDLLSILSFITPDLPNKIKNQRETKKEWGYKYKFEFDDKYKTLYIREYCISEIHGIENFDELRPEAIKILPNWDIKYRRSVCKGESRHSVFYANEWDTPDNILKLYSYIKSLGYTVEVED